ncbi:hypothetical protein O988_02668 [Pseudogymnoascus sp. VKM F-3808]|nr:hypothetical protein O988_02668 [Pseudogymnoascus sp. VKM F-3808]
MPTIANNARLRTKTGCISCRQRKKKCDEVRPRCGGCCHVLMECLWPTSQHLLEDGRRRMRSKRSPRPESKTSTSNEDKSSPRSPTIATEGPTKPNEIPNNNQLSNYTTDLWSNHAVVSLNGNGADDLFRYYVKQFLPCLIHERSHPRFHNGSYWINLALGNDTVMEAALACAATSISYMVSSDRKTVMRTRQRALTHQTAAIRAIRRCIELGSVNGTEDWLLGTVVLLTILANRDLSCPAWTRGTHVRAIMQLLKCRQAARMVDFTRAECNPEALHVIFERKCYESLLYHGTIMMTYDPNFDALVSNEAWQMIDGYFQTSLLPTDEKWESWPVLGVPYKLFRLIVTISNLARRSPLGEEDLAIAALAITELHQWVNVVALNPSSPGRLYVLAAKILLEDVLSRQPEGISLKDSVQADIQCFVNEISAITVTPLFSKYNLWPLSIIQHIATDVGAKRIIKDRITATLRLIDGCGVMEVSQERLDRFVGMPGLQYTMGISKDVI